MIKLLINHSITQTHHHYVLMNVKMNINYIMSVLNMVMFALIRYHVGTQTIDIEIV